MLKELKIKYILPVMVLASIAAPVSQAAEFEAEQKEEIETIIKDYLMDNPEVIFESIEAYRLQQQENEKKTAEAAIKENIKTLTSSKAPSVGPADASITVVEFFDYNCGYCKRALPDIQAIVKDDDDVRFVFKEMPILGPTSMTAAQWALAAHKQDKYFEYHVALMEHRGPKTEEQLAKLAEDLDLDVEKMKEDANSEAIKKEIAADVSLGREIGISGTPAFIVGETLYPGYIGKDGLAASIKEARE